MLPQKRLKVIPNPFAVPLDQHGRPCGVVLYDPAHSNGFARHIGAKLERNVIEKRSFEYSKSRKQNVGGGGQLDKVDISWSFDLAPVEIVDTRYHRRFVANGSLLPADEQTARVCRVAFVDPMKALGEAQTKAVAEWENQNGDKPPVADWKLANLPAMASKGKKAGNE